MGSHTHSPRESRCPPRAAPLSTTMPAKKTVTTKAAATEKKPMYKELISAALKANSASRKGTSRQAIEKHVAASSGNDAEKIRSYIKRALVSGVESGLFVSVTGNGASGSFKLAPKAKAPAKPKSPAKKKAATKAKSPKKKTAKKTTDVRKPAAKSKKTKTPKSKAVKAVKKAVSKKK